MRLIARIIILASLFLIPFSYGTANAQWSLSIATTGDSSNLAGVSADATDGFDSGIDLADNDPNRKIYFPHAEWNPGGDYQTDIKAVYDPTLEVKQWAFTVKSYLDPSQSGYESVQVTFQTDLDLSPGFDAFVRDTGNGEIINVTPSFVVEYQIPYGTSYRSFDLVIGNEAPPGPDPVAFGFTASSGGHIDTGNLGGVMVGATDGFDPGLDNPEPGPPPSNYLTAYFRHSDWPLGSRYQTDQQAPYDPLADSKTWPITVESDQSGSVVLTFDPNIQPTDRIGLQLRDLTDNTTFNLFPSLTYAFDNGGSATIRHFELTIQPIGSVPELDPASRTLPQGWTMVGFPLIPAPGAGTLGDVIMDQSPGYSYLFDYLGPSGYSALDPADSAVQGQGYWFATTEGFQWTMAGEKDLDGATINLDAGWNLVGYPLWFAGPISGIQVVHGGSSYGWTQAVGAGLVNANIFGFDNGSDNYQLVTTMEAWHGYWLRANVSGVSLFFDWPNFQVPPLETVLRDFGDLPESQIWRTDLVIQDSQGRSRLVTLGVHPEATLGFDPLLDQPLPPAGPNGGPQLSIEHPEWETLAGRSFGADFVPPETPELAWNALVSTEDPGDITLTWTMFDWPRGQDLQIYLPQQNRVVVLSMASQGSVTLAVGTEPLVVQVRTPAMSSAEDEIPGLKYGIQVYPNPFNPMTTVSFSLTRPGKADIKIYSLRGELVGIIGGSLFEAGHHQVVWRGKDRQGKNVPSGSYFAKLYVDGKAMGPVTKMSLIR